MSWQRAEDLAWVQSAHSGVVQVATFPDTQVYSLDGGAAVIWKLLDEPMGRDELVSRITEDVLLIPDDISEEVDRCLSQLAGLGLVEQR
ncbi:PqqD family protein [Acidipropionibacterium jensenii]|uniref:PqqD family protein n=1 Tax=Acidipropionibacterium jensenii TaxID=1749 RepID=A0A3T0S2D4_9ACTN|nr:PqqD family protein [Acidipropionibacterium jensenii]AZZ40507.1 PqqD family protein [Acidipropionibacterium jensenii]MDN5962749.1 PqqD family protein [Propionibacterium sp.]MDN5985580.1 PqqD family protein [Propionibacterium sp.]MDN6567134.1 PqqD family protein [Actinomyces sp.]